MSAPKGLPRQLSRSSASAAAASVRRLGPVATRRRLVRAGVPRWYVRNEVLRRRWQCLGRHVVVLHNGPLSPSERRAAAVLEAGPRAALDGVSSLQEAGLKGLQDELVHVSARKGSKPGRLPGSIVRETRRLREADVIDDGGIRRTRSAVAAVHAALWARSDRQAKLFVVMTVQQGLASAADLAAVLATVKRHRRRPLLRALLEEVAAGSQSLGELDVVGAMRRRGLPVPRQQVLRRRPEGNEYLDCEFPEYGLVLEVDGAGHVWAERVLADLLRDLRLVVEGRQVIRIPLTAWVLDREAVLDALAAVFRSCGWQALAA